MGTKLTNKEKQYYVTLFNMDDPNERRTEVITASCQKEAERIALSGGIINRANGWGVLGSRRKPTAEDVKDFFMLDEKLRKDLVDSMLFEKGERILSGTIGDIRINVEVAGDVSVTWQGVNYSSIAEFPEELVNVIRQGHLFEDRRANVYLNNWFEITAWKDNELLYEDFFEDIGTLETEDEGKNILLDFFFDSIIEIEPNEEEEDNDTDNLITPEKIAAAVQVLIDNGIEADEAKTVLQAVCYVLLDKEIYPEKQ